MDESRKFTPDWLPWAAVACLVALAALFGELWRVERARGRLLREAAELAEGGRRAAENQLEAERILARREFAVARAVAPEAVFLEPLAGQPAGAWAVVAWNPAGRRAVLRLGGLPPEPAARYQLWIGWEDEPDGVSCGVFLDVGGSFDLPGPVPSGARFVLSRVASGRFASLREARAAGAIILASRPPGGGNPGR